MSAICNSPTHLIIARAPDDFEEFFSCVVTYRTGASRRLYIITSAVVRDQLGPVRCPAVFTRMKQIFECNDVHIIIKIRYHFSKKKTNRLVKLERLKLTLTVLEMFLYF